MVIATDPPPFDRFECSVCAAFTADADGLCDACRPTFIETRRRLATYGHLNEPEIRPDTTMAELFDSLDETEFVEETERISGRRFSTADLERVKTVADFLRLVRPGDSPD